MQAVLTKRCGLVLGALARAKVGGGMRGLSDGGEGGGLYKRGGWGQGGREQF